MAKNFTLADRAEYDAIGSAERKTPGRESGRRTYAQTTKKNADEEYRFTARMPAKYGQYLNEKAYQERTTITAILQKLVSDDMLKHPDVLKNLDELNG